MTYKQVKHLLPAEFKRLCGVQRQTFSQMVGVLRDCYQQKAPGRPSKLSVEDQLMLTLEYWREYRTYFHIAFIMGYP